MTTKLEPLTILGFILMDIGGLAVLTCLVLLILKINLLPLGYIGLVIMFLGVLSEVASVLKQDGGQHD